MQCPKCKSFKSNTYRHPFAKVWCEDCGFVIRDEGEKEHNKVHYWLDIESAPKDGTKILVCDKDVYNPMLASFRMCNFFKEELWQTVYGQVLTPEYWMELPEQP